MYSILNPELHCMLTRPSKELNQRMVQAELKAMYIRKAYNVGLSLSEYCRRFSVTKTWEKVGFLS